MKTSILNLFLMLAVVSGPASDPVRITDKRGDAKFERGNPVAAFDLVAVTFEGLPDNQLKITFSGDGPIAEKGTTYSWYAVWLDLDIDSTTGDTYGDVGCDLILAAESVRNTEDWTGEVTAKSQIGREFSVKFIEAGASGNDAFAIYESELFAKYPQFRAAAFAHHNGAYSDYMSGGRLNYVQAFERTEKAAPAPDPFSFKKKLDPRSGKKQSHTFGITPRDRSIAVDLTPTKSNGDHEWNAKIDWNIRGEDSSCVHIRFHQDEVGEPLRSYIRTNKGSGSHKNIDLESKIEVGETTRLKFAWDSRRKKLFINGEEVIEIPIDFQPTSSILYVYSAEVLAENLVIE